MNSRQASEVPMSNVSTLRQPNATEDNGKEKAKKALLETLSSAARAFWSYTEDAGDADTKPFKGIL